MLATVKPSSPCTVFLPCVGKTGRVVLIDEGDPLPVHVDFGQGVIYSYRRSEVDLIDEKLEGDDKPCSPSTSSLTAS